MTKLRISLLLVIFMIIAVTAKKLSGDDMKTAINTLLKALGQLSTKSDMKLTTRNVRSSSESPSGDENIYDVEVFDDKNLLQLCKIEIKTLPNGGTKMICTCTPSSDGQKPIKV